MWFPVVAATRSRGSQLSAGRAKRCDDCGGDMDKRAHVSSDTPYSGEPALDEDRKDHGARHADDGAKSADPGVAEQTGRGSSEPDQSGPDSFSGNTDRAHDR